MSTGSSYQKRILVRSPGSPCPYSNCGGWLSKWKVVWSGVPEPVSSLGVIRTQTVSHSCPLRSSPEAQTVQLS